MRAVGLGVSLILSFGALAAQAASPFQHPAVSTSEAPTDASSIEARGVIVGHPASPRWKLVHANGEHPAVLVSAREAQIDPNAFRVQPPASTTWTLAPVPVTAVAVVAR